MDKMTDKMKNLIEAARDGARGSFAPLTSIQPFNFIPELWLDYLERFRTFFTADLTKEKEAQVFLTNQSKVTYKLHVLNNLAAQQSIPKSINELKLTGEQLDPK